ncbi:MULTISPECIES: 4-hydroxy-tetrahydrodipicolinate synthase [Pelosinus]|jgi:4-hydroxy-tetrahydrodipicolinate synthase|uniref:4-hydroxy-tetrahydrodipicolinate synthase n=1 Tax=Pelosinus fermentans B4 TaxID=1149862 RepID=I8RGC0_9FIRM|nr:MULTISPECIES: 4-hydroxy-tetrahydrodipicolinate synthase [Pelosinus]EIW18678.1 dihydrodipicolinate synthase [Pelosinus fermentans B4]EIW25205.1 Dihydrodipicolinate synthase [Pelosinus fermentans A11]OAM96463.1 Dihydrodipicolinate synthase [Pelosinus fermentans DSM 17108]SDR40430.1 4-hydroxy-tetrahydrodipicolinate synthase [Pelosinus fermentans]
MKVTENKAGFTPRGIIPAVITPLTAEEKFNEKAMRKLVNYLIGGGVHGLFITGTTGEFYGLTPEEKREVIQVTMDEVKGRVPVYAGTNGITTRESIMLTQLAEECKVDAVSVLTPMFVTPNQEQLYKHYKDIAASTSLPVILYNNPPKTGVNLAPATVAKLAEIPNIVSIKDSSGDLTLTAEYIRLTQDREDFSVLMGRDTLIYGALLYGATGSIASCANVAPRLCADIYEKYMAGDLAGALKAQFALAPLRIAFSIGTFPAVIKESLILLGIEAGPCMDPAGPMTHEERAQLSKVLIEMGLLK